MMQYEGTSATPVKPSGRGETLRVTRRHQVTLAVRWWLPGDHPTDNDPSTVGPLVRPYRTPTISSDDECTDCGFLAHDHGWIKEGKHGLNVCPGSWIIGRCAPHLVLSDWSFRDQFMLAIAHPTLIEKEKL